MELFALIALFFWLALTLDRSRSWPGDLTLPAESPNPSESSDGGVVRGGPSPDSILAVVPARNEAEMLERTLPALLSQDALTSVIVVDDRSDDGTAERASEVARSVDANDRLRVVEAGPTPAGWAGKVHAMASGVRALSDEAQSPPEWILFTDADIHHRPGSVSSLLARAAEGYDLVSVMARLRTESFWEKLLIPTFVYFFQLIYPFRRVRRADSAVAAAAGGCVLLRREALERAGGLEAIRGALIDDVSLARAIARAGGRLWLGLDRGIRSLRPYPRLTDVWRMVSRSAYDQLGYRPWLLVGVVLGLALFFVGPLVLLPIGFAQQVPDAYRTVAWCLLALGLQTLALLPSVRHHGISAIHAVVLPISTLLFGAMTLSSAWAHHTGRGVSWRDRPAGVERERQ